jgi:hypothetical protein
MWNEIREAAKAACVRSKPRGVCFGVAEKRFLAKICFKHLGKLKLLKRVEEVRL